MLVQLGDQGQNLVIYIQIWKALQLAAPGMAVSTSELEQGKNTVLENSQLQCAGGPVHFLGEEAWFT